MTQAESLLDSRSFRNKLEALVNIAARKRPLPSDKEIAEFLQPVLDAAGIVSIAPSKPAEAPLPVAGPLPSEERAIPQVERSLTDKMDDIIRDYAEAVRKCPMDMKGVRLVLFPMELPVAEFTGYTNDRIDAPFFVDPTEMTMMDTGRGGWLLPCRMR